MNVKIHMKTVNTNKKFESKPSVYPSVALTKLPFEQLFMLYNRLTNVTKTHKRNTKGNRNKRK